jgi:hypothetical protein
MQRAGCDPRLRSSNVCIVSGFALSSTTGKPDNFLFIPAIKANSCTPHHGLHHKAEGKITPPISEARNQQPLPARFFRIAAANRCSTTALQSRRQDRMHQ